MVGGQTDCKIVFVHGYTFSSQDNWYPNISTELNKLGIDFDIPNLPGGDHPHAEDWLENMHKFISETNKPLVLVGHSLGTRAILLYLEKYKPKVKMVLLIATFANRLDNANKYDEGGYPDFFEHLVNLEQIKPLVEKFVIMHSKDDGLDYEQAVELTEQLDAKLITYADRGHFSDPENALIVLHVLREELDF